MLLNSSALLTHKNCPWVWCWQQIDWPGTPGSTDQQHPSDVDKDQKAQDMLPLHPRVLHQAALKNCHNRKQSQTNPEIPGTLTLEMDKRTAFFSFKPTYALQTLFEEKLCIKLCSLNKQPSYRNLSYQVCYLSDYHLPPQNKTGEISALGITS